MAEKHMKAVILFRGGIAADWDKQNPVLRNREPGWATDTGVLKIGDGITPWKDLKPANEQYVVNAKTHFDFPSIGSVNIIYKAYDEKQLYQWNAELLKYEPLGGNDLQINVIHGGGAKLNGTT